MSTLAKNTKTPLKMQKTNNPQKYKRILNIKCQVKGAQFLHLACQGVAHPLPPYVKPVLPSIEKANDLVTQFSK